MKAFILAAGVSRRLYPHTYDIPKCLLNVGGKPIIHYQLEALKGIGVMDITVIVGYHREILISHLKESFPSFNYNFVVNHHFFETNTAFSIHKGRSFLDDDLILMNADVIYTKSVLEKLIKSKHQTALAVDIKSCGREEVKVIDGGSNRIVAIGKELIESQCLGEFIGVAKLSKGFCKLFSNSLNDLIESGGLNDYFEAAIHPLLEATEIHYVNVSEFPCMEIDFIEDLEKARNLFR
tara:strand:- start:33 stop:743 length:711 start_codon:yes stop_codon:yes gene_type:complete